MLSADIGRYPSTPVVIDHCGFPQCDGATIAAGSPLLAMAEIPQVTVKITSHNLVHLAARSVSRPLSSSQLVGRFGTVAIALGVGLPPNVPRHLPALVELAVGLCRSDGGRESRRARGQHPAALRVHRRGE